MTPEISRKPLNEPSCPLRHLSLCAAHPSSSLLPPKLQVRCRCRYLLFLTTHHIIMFPKTTLTFLIVGALSVNALNVLVARNPAPELECESSLLLSAVSHRDLTSVPFNSSTAMEQGPRISPRFRDPGFPLLVLWPGPRTRGQTAATGHHHLGRPLGVREQLPKTLAHCTISLGKTLPQ